MTSINSEEHLRPWSSATYRIEVEGCLEESWSDRFAGMRIRCRKRVDQSFITSLTGQLKDQSELTGILNNLAEHHLPILTVEIIDSNDEGSEI
jgi:hypothetical protein